MIRKAELKQILFPTDFSETSLRAGDIASTLARAFNADMTLLHIIETSVYKSVFPELDVETFSESSVSKAVENRLNQYAEELIGGSSLKVDTLYQSGTVSDLVYEAMGSTRADLVVTGLHGVKGVQKYFAGSNAYKIATRSAVPVISVPQSAKGEIRTILLPVVEDLNSLEKVPWAGFLGSKLKVNVKVLGVTEPNDEEVLDAVQSNVRAALTYLGQHGITPEVSYVECENFAEAVLVYSEKMNADLVCIMTDRDKNSTGIFPGGAANQILNQSKTSVFTMHPDAV